MGSSLLKPNVAGPKETTMSPGQHRAGHGFHPVASPGNAQKDPMAPGEGPKQLPLAAPHNPGQNLPSQGQESANKERALCHPGSTGCLRFLWPTQRSCPGQPKQLGPKGLSRSCFTFQKPHRV